ncbi:MAG: hypothetical protein RLY69_232 [Verrucomicrobiota bacterium]
MDLCTGLVLIFSPALVFSVFGLNVDEAAMDFVNWVGAFVFAVGLSYAWALSREDLPIVWKITGLIRSVIAVFLIAKVLSGSMPANWLGVALCDGFFAMVQFGALWRRRNGGGE